MIYLIVSFLLMIISFSRKKVFFYFSYCSIFLYFTTHYGYGFDWINYYNTYTWSTTMLSSPYEPGIFLIMKYMSGLGFSYGSFMFLILTFNYLCMFVFCNTFKHKTFALFCMFSFFGFYMYSEQIRQGVAISIIMLGLGLHGFRSKKIYIYTLLACLFHISAIFYLICHFTYSTNSKQYKRNMLLISVSVILMLVVFVVPSVLSFIPYIGGKMAAYSESYNASGVEFLIALVLSKYTWLYGLLVFILVNIQKEKNDGKVFSSIVSAYFLLLSKTTPILMRFGFYYIPSLAKGLDDYMYDKTKVGIIYVKKTIVYLCILLVSSATMWNPTLFQSTNYSLTVFSDQDINLVMSQKCTIAYKNLYGVDLFPTCYK